MLAHLHKDGTHVPMTLCYHRGLLRRDGSNPVLVHVYGEQLVISTRVISNLNYTQGGGKSTQPVSNRVIPKNWDFKLPVYVCCVGCYGENLYMGYQPDKLPLLSRGWVLAYCHVRYAATE